jgi:hypothetical protein
MAPVDSSSKALNAVARALGWLTSVATMVVLGFIVNRWPDKAGPVAAGIVGVCCSFYFYFYFCFNITVAIEG